MGNRAEITTRDMDCSVYLHWNGSNTFVEPILKYCDLQGYRPPSSDCYGWARLCQVLGNAIGGTLSLGIHSVPEGKDLDWLDPGDNGVYVIDGWKVVERHGYHCDETITDQEMTNELLWINSMMPEHCRLDRRYIMAQELTNDQIEVGDIVWRHWHDGFRESIVVHKTTQLEHDYKDKCIELGIEVPEWAWEASKHDVGTPVTDDMLSAKCCFMANPNSYLGGSCYVRVGTGDDFKYEKRPVTRRVTKGDGTLPEETKLLTDAELNKMHVLDTVYFSD